MHCASCRLHLLGEGGRRGFFCDRYSFSMYRSLPKPHWTRSPAGRYVARNLAHAARRGDSRFRTGKALLKAFPALTEDSEAHRFEHAIEVELPFLQTARPGVQMVPIAVGTTRWLLLEQLGQAIASAIQSSEFPVLMVASSDMNHYEDDDTTRIKDHKAIRKILSLEPHALYETVVNESI